ncbi:hypothetical protein [Desulfospira joergensenii]|uniref:hypothetical protein n=1 Tax=Desulfospira joergensenii TaxID=53329 RepID=UPI0004881C33|nr:hypothetical protein [Desulfospira joergensenii]
MNEKKDIMGKILGADDKEFAAKTRELDCLIYRSGTGGKEEGEENLDIGIEGMTEKSWKISKENVSVEVWEGKAKIRLKVGTGKYKTMSMKRIASIAVDAILEELKREDQEK